MRKLMYGLISLLILNLLILSGSLNTDANNELELINKLNIEYHDLKNNIQDLNKKINDLSSNNVQNIPVISPIKPNDFIGVSSEFGLRIHPIYNVELFHKGVDLMGKYNTDVFSTIEGVVIEKQISNVGYGNMIIIRNKQYIIVLAHLNHVYVNKYDWVKQGDLIGTIGDTGTITGIHLHYEIYENDKLVNPLDFFYMYNNNTIFANINNKNYDNSN